MSQLLLPGAQPFVPFEPSVLAEPQAVWASVALPLESLEHGAYYAGKLGATPAVARWHAKRRRFVLGEIILGRQRVKTVAHVACRGSREWFAPSSKTAPNDTCQVSDFAFETCS
jgi:hypothetical protein